MFAYPSLQNAQFINSTQLLIPTFYPVTSNNKINIIQAKAKNPNFKPHSKFSEEEDKKLRELVDKFGEKLWIKIANEMPGRNSRQCRERWLYYLSPNLNTEPWTIEEDELLLQKQSEFGNSWVKICKFLQGRTDQMCKNRFFILQRKMENKTSRRRNVNSFVKMILPNTQVTENLSGNPLPLQVDLKQNEKIGKNNIDMPVVGETANFSSCFDSIIDDPFISNIDDPINCLEICDEYFNNFI